MYKLVCIITNNFDNLDFVIDTALLEKVEKTALVLEFALEGQGMHNSIVLAPAHTVVVACCNMTLLDYCLVDMQTFELTKQYCVTST